MVGYLELSTTKIVLNVGKQLILLTKKKNQGVITRRKWAWILSSLSL